MAENHNGVVSIAGSTPISNTAYSQLVASTPYNSTKLVIANGTDQSVTLAVGASGSEVDLIAVASGQTETLNLSLNQVPASSRLSVEAVGAATTKGYYSVSILP